MFQNDISFESQIKTYLLEKVPFTIQQVVSRYGMTYNGDTQLLITQIMDQMVFRLVSTIAAMKHPKVETVNFVAEWPATWWDALKLQLTTKSRLRKVWSWLFRNRQPKLTSKKEQFQFDVVSYYPHLNVLPDNDKYMRVDVLKVS